MINAKPTLVAAGTIFSSIFMASELTSAEGAWLLIALGVISFLAILVNNALGAAQKYKQLKQGSISPTPLPVVVEKSLAEKFVDVPRFNQFSDYVHKAHHEIRNEIQKVEVDGEKRGEDTQDLIRELDRDNEKRIEAVHHRINAVSAEIRKDLTDRMNVIGDRVGELVGELRARK